MLVVRRAIESDIDAIVALEKHSFSVPWTEKSVRDTFLEERAIVLVAENDGKFLGYCIVYSVFDEAEIARIAVEPSCRRQGVGQELLNQIKNICHEKRILYLMLEVRESNEVAREFYCAQGFGVDGIRKKYYQCPEEDAILMSMMLPTVPTRN